MEESESKVTVQKTYSDKEEENFHVNDITKSFKKHSSQISGSGSPCLVRESSLDSGRGSKASDKNMARLLKVICLILMTACMLTIRLSPCFLLLSLCSSYEYKLYDQGH